MSAIDEFRLSLGLARALSDIDRIHYQNPPKKSEESPVSALRGGSSILMVAAFEKLLRNMCSEQAQRFKDGKKHIKIDKLPKAIRIHAIWASLECGLKGKPFEPKKEKVDRIPEIVDRCQNIISGIIDTEVFSETGGNPNSAAVKVMFKAFDLPDVFTVIRPSFDKLWKKQESASFLEEKLDEIVTRRHVVAHTANCLSISRSDVLGGIKFIDALGDVLCQGLSNHVTKIIAAIK